MARNTLARIDTRALSHNLARIRELAPDSRVMAVVKADAYGHRLDLCLPALASADLLAVATLEEARAIRRLGTGQAILLLEGVSHDEDLAVADELGLELTVHHVAQIEALERYGRSTSPRLWLKIDSGMHRLGVPPEQAAACHARLRRLVGVEQVNLMSHFARADEADPAPTARQMQRFEQAVEGLEGERCLANSAAIVAHPGSRADWVRAGILLYGISPFEDGHAGELGFRPVMTLVSELIAINEVAAGEAIGYGARFRTERDLRVGVASIGYGDGYPRSLVDGSPVLVDGHRCALAGRVSMDMITIDLTACPGASIGSPVVLWGDGLPVEEVARHAGTIPYELVCRITRRVRYRGC
ncbi:alanine racemase [Wenzhouxiangella marina]|uniref:Alanine racemase n=1 Tax=Wenzhouxiangella marina TaxID=1579979 RepID=A0A0K0XVW0_9GAMM|nr:alanine racemase [Wenzhouxiangella marina]AKS41844.1 alanine racemase [Wenzhouxiangella marina]MBB6086391.1 alanine racemase [Wenzhouxiangella marina]